MDLVRLLGGHAPWMRKYQVAATVSILGVPHLVTAAGTAGLAVATTTGAVNMVGINIDTATYGTAQVAGGNPEALCSFIINPDAVWKIPMSGGATEGTVLATRTVTTASTTGLAVTTGDDWSSPTLDEGYLWGYDGANAGHTRKITSVSSTAATVTVALPVDTVVGDKFLYFPSAPFTLETLTLTTALTQARQDVAVATNTAEFITVALVMRNLASNGLYESYVEAISRYHALNPTA